MREGPRAGCTHAARGGVCSRSPPARSRPPAVPARPPAKAASSGVRSTTRVPYSCLDSLAEAAAVDLRSQLPLSRAAAALRGATDGWLHGALEQLRWRGAMPSKCGRLCHPVIMVAAALAGSCLIRSGGNQ